jgi:hypothetical protein
LDFEYNKAKSIGKFGLPVVKYKQGKRLFQYKKLKLQGIYKIPNPGQ